MDKILFKSSQTLLSKKEVKKILDENFNLASNIISLIYSEENIRLNYFCITEKSKKLLLNLEKIEPYLILKGIFEEKEYRDNFDKFLLLVNDFSSFKNNFFSKKTIKLSKNG